MWELVVKLKNAPIFGKDSSADARSKFADCSDTSLGETDQCFPAGFTLPRPLLVCFSHLRWSFVWQRPQHLLSRAAKQFDVLFIEEPVFEAAPIERLRVEAVAPGIQVAVPILKEAERQNADQSQERLIRRHLDGLQSRKRIFWYYTPAAMGFSGNLARDLTLYDNMDELSAFRGASQELVAQEAELFAQADLVFTGGQSLFEAKRDCHTNIHCFPSSVDTAHFAQARRRECPDPADQAAIPHPRLGFFGVIDERFDCALTAAIADLRPDWHLIMIGPVVKIDPATLPKRLNIHWLGPKTYGELPDYLRHWDVGLMPFAINEATQFISPTKTPEFLAAGLPVISTPIADVVRSYGEDRLVEIAQTPVAAVLAAEALMARPKEPWLLQVDRRLAKGSWDRTWQSMHALIQSKLGRPASAQKTAARPALSS
jgi:hypothetical protein